MGGGIFAKNISPFKTLCAKHCFENFHLYFHDNGAKQAMCFQLFMMGFKTD